MEPATHIIGKQKIKLRYHGNTDALALRQMMSSVCSDELPARLNNLLDRYDDKDFVLRIDKLNVQVSVDDDGNLQEALAKAIIEQIEAALRQKLAQRTTNAVSIDTSFARTLQFYLEKGYLPWWSLVKDGPAFRDGLRQAWERPSLLHIIPEVTPILGSPHVRSRLLSLLSAAQFETFVLSSAAWTQQAWDGWMEHIAIVRRKTGKQISSNVFEQLVRDAMLETIGAPAAPTEAPHRLEALLAAVLKDRGIALPHDEIAQPRPITEQPTTEKPVHAPEADERIYISNAGLVLVALYLPAFFSNVGLLEDSRLLNIPRAVALLRYLTFEDAAFEEFDLVLEKILCGRSLAESVEAKHHVTPDEEEQVEALLQSVIKHWSVLKSTTPAGLRHNFLQREGNLVFQNNQWTLTVQLQAHDILLDYLPWNISMIKLPWMQHLMTVKWNT